ncbi:MAG: TIM barrel protein [Acidobacteria bacterium]|nr:TIM barrel protein [Acidobacteriota bacterium]
MTISRRNLLASTTATAAAILGAGATRLGAADGAPPFKLRYGPHVGWLNPEPPVRQLEIFAQHGYTAFEYNGLPSRTPQQCEEIRRKMDDLKMSMGTFVVNRGGWRPTAMPDRGAHRMFLEDVRRAVELHKIVGNEVATVTSGLGVLNLTFEQQTRNCVDVLKRAAEIVEKSRLVLVLEPLNVKVDHAGYFVVYSDHASEIIGQVNHPQVKILFDCYHQQISEGNIINNINMYWDMIGYFQTGDVPGRKEPGTGEMNYQNIFKTLYRRGYKGIVGLEHGMLNPGIEGFQKVTEAYRQADSFATS